MFQVTRIKCFLLLFEYIIYHGWFRDLRNTKNGILALINKQNSHLNMQNSQCHLNEWTIITYYLADWSEVHVRWSGKIILFSINWIFLLNWTFTDLQRKTDLEEWQQEVLFKEWIKFRLKNQTKKSNCTNVRILFSSGEYAALTCEIEI